jgi:membrane-bound metal-dependent hydrolase YbcI (DUF457 family)
MILPGHLAAGYMVATAVIKIAKPELDPASLNYLLAWGTFSGMVPDLDSFWVFFKNKRFIFKDETINHRDFLSHVPLVWFLICLVLTLFLWFGQNQLLKYGSLILLFGSLSHFIFDSIQMGVMWLWPFSRRKLALLNRYHGNIVKEESFLKYWLRFGKLYYINFTETFWAEVVLTVIGIIVFLN